MAGMVIICSIGLPISLSRWPDIGFQWVFVHHIAITLTAYICYFRSNTKNYNIDLLAISLMLTSMVISGSFSFGLQSGAVTFAIFTSFIVGFAWGLRLAIIYSIGWCVFIIGTGWLFIEGHLQYVISPNDYSQSIGAWLVVALGSSFTIIFILIAANQAYIHLLRLLEKIEQQKQEIENIANIDYITGFYNARLCNPHIAQAISIAKREQTLVAILFIDLNEFKKVNDTHGHDLGDSVLSESSKRIKSVLRDMDIACRVGGDEFLIILPTIHNIPEIIDITERIHNAIKPSFDLANATIQISCSIGAALYPNNAEDPDTLRKMADAAMYKAKKAHSSHVEFYAHSALAE